MVEKSCPSKAAHVENGKLHIDEKCLACGVCTGKCPFKAVRHESPVVYRIYVGGTWGKQTRMGTPLSRFVTRAEIEPLLEKTMLWFKENAMPKERLGKAIDRLGIEKFEHDVFSDDLLNRREGDPRKIIPKGYPMKLKFLAALALSAVLLLSGCAAPAQKRNHP